jgi:hypothetical protein
MSFMSEMPRSLCVGSSGWEYLKREEKEVRYVRKGPVDPKAVELRKQIAKTTDKDQIAALRRDLRNLTWNVPMVPRESTVIRYVGSGDRKAKGALNKAIAGYKVLWNSANKDAENFRDLVHAMRSGRIKESAEEIGETGNFTIDRDDQGSIFDKYDFGSYTR